MAAPSLEADPIAALHRHSIALYQANRLAEAEQACLSMLALDASSFDALAMLGALATQSGRLARAEQCFREALRVNGAAAHVHNNLGIVLLELSRPLEAVASFDRAIARMPEFSDAHCNRAAALHHLGRCAEAVAGYEAAIARQPRLARAHRGRGAALYQLRRNAAALESYDLAVSLEPDVAVSHNLRGEVLLEMDRVDEALQSCDRSLRLDPTLLLAHLTRAEALRRRARPAEALAASDRALALHPQNAAAHTSHGAALLELDRHEEALTHLRRAVAIDANYAQAHWYMGLCLRRVDRRTEALDAWDRTRALQPASAATLVNRGLVLYELGRIEDALRDYREAMRLAPQNADARWNASWCLLKLGQFTEGWDLFESRPAAPGPVRQLTKPRWTGLEDLTGRTLLVRAEQGLGDTIQFSRYLRRVADLGARVVLEAPPALHGLLRGLAGMSELIGFDDPLPRYDYHCRLMSLPHALGTTLETIPGEVPYLKANEQKVLQWRQSLGPRTAVRVGLVWSAGVRPDQPQLWYSERRNVPFEKLAQLKGAGCELYSVQQGQPAESQLSQAQASNWEGPQIVDCAALQRDSTDTAALIENLDLVITVDTAVAHMAGALGKPVWILLCFDACWRWLLDRSDSPWYPSARLYRQAVAGDWDSVLQQVRADLEKLAR
jgi:tetratricopeptide (TPR) repeat protein